MNEMEVVGLSWLSSCLVGALKAWESCSGGDMGFLSTNYTDFTNYLGFEAARVLGLFRLSERLEWNAEPVPRIGMVADKKWTTNSANYTN